MPKFRNYQTNFSGGLLSEGMLGRVDLAQYENGCKQLENWWPKVTGGMRRRPGSLIMEIVDNSFRVESFIFSETQTYLICFRVPTVGGPQDDIIIIDPDTGDVVDTINLSGIAWSEDIIKRLSITQVADVMLCAAAEFPTLIIRRTSATDFEQDSFDFEGTPPLGAYPKKMPFWKFEDSDTTISVNGYVEGSVVTVTASKPVFTDRHISRAIRYRGKQIYITNVNGPIQPQSTCIGTILEELDRGAVLTFNPAESTPKDFDVGEIIVGRDSGVKAEVIETSSSSVLLSMIAGRFDTLTTEEVEGLQSGNIAKITAAASVNPPASAYWDEEAFTPTHGWPTVIEFHSQRLWIGGSSSLPAHIFGSRVAAFFNFDVGDALPADSIQVAISGKQINLVTDIVSGRHMQVFTDKGEFYVPQSDDRPIEPATFDIKQQTRYGSNTLIEPKVFDESTLFVQAQGSAVREYIWVDQLKGYSSDAVSLIAEEFIKDVKEIEVLYGGYDRPEQIAFFVNGDGTITWYHAARAESIRTWGNWSTQGQWKSLCVIQDKLFALVERESFAGVTQYIERFELDVSVDGAVQLDDPAVQSSWDMNGVNQYPETLELQITSGVDDHLPVYYLGEFYHSAGVVDIGPLEVDNVTIGLGFTSILETMPIEVKDNQGVTGGMPKRIVQADVYLASTLAVQLQGNTVATFLSQQDLSEPPATITGPRKFYLLGYSERPTLLVESSVPLPCEVLSLGAEVEY